MNQKIDKIAMAIAAVLIIGAIIWPLLVSDPGAASADQIEKHLAAIERTLDEQSGVDLGAPRDLAGEVGARFQVAELPPFPEWTMYRRPATFQVEITPELVPPTLSPGAICKIEVVREAGSPNRVYHRVSGLLGTPTNAKIESEVLERREGKDDQDQAGEWVEVGPVGAGEPAGPFEMVVEEGLTVGTFSAYRLRTRAKSLNPLEFSGGGPVATVESLPSEPVYLPPDVAWEVAFLQGEQPGMVPMATLVRHTWDWTDMKAKRAQASATEKDGVKLLGTNYTLDLIRFDKKPAEVNLKGEEPPLKILDKVKPFPLDPKTWESDDPACAGTAGAPGEGTAGATTPAAEATPAPAPPKPAPASGGGLFGGDD